MCDDPQHGSGDLTLAEILPILFERGNAFQTLWNLDIVLTVGLLAFLAAQNHSLPFTFQVLLPVGYAVFALSNLNALLTVAKQRKILANTTLKLLNGSNLADLRDSAAKNPPTLIDDLCFSLKIPAIYAASLLGIIIFHLFFDVVVCFTLYWMASRNI